MNINNIHQEIDKIFDDFQNKLDENNFGLHIEPTLINWAKEDDIDCSAPAISNALNSALSRFTKNITLKKRLLIMINILYCLIAFL